MVKFDWISLCVMCFMLSGAGNVIKKAFRRLKIDRKNAHRV